ncbi:MAG: hypothetical protein JWN86_2620 [Planctomycetota bacterium]|nr:hypothetical protein [Planctomycetota bacterium]
MPRIRVTLRKMMAAIAIVAVLLGGYMECKALRRRAEDYRRKAENHADIEGVLRAIAATSGEGSPVDISPGPGIRSRRFTVRDVIEREAALHRKYERAARYPWLSVAPDEVMPR